MDKIWKYLTIGLMVVLVAVGVFGFFKYRSYESALAKARNELAEKDKTIQTQDGAYTKLVGEYSGIVATNKELQATISKLKQDVLVAQQDSLTWKKKYDNLVTIVPNPFPGVPTDWKPVGPPTCKDKQDEFLALTDYGLVKAGCRIKTYDPQTQARTLLQPGSRPLKLNLAITRDADKQFHSYVKVEPPDDQNISIDIASTKVDFEPLSEKGYEKIGVHLDFGASSAGVLGGAGVNYRAGALQFGPSIWGVSLDKSGASYYGINFNWTPFRSSP
jgi:hypothetical protein